MRAHEFITEEEVTIKLNPKNVDTPAHKFVKQMYSLYPRNPLNGKEFFMVWGQGDDQELAGFQLAPSTRGDDWVTIEFLYTYPQKKGVGGKALQELQNKATQFGINLDLYTWTRGKVPVNKLKQFYGKEGFTPLSKAKGGQTMLWTPNPNT